jgi:hypothetical protein
MINIYDQLNDMTDREKELKELIYGMKEEIDPIVKELMRNYEIKKRTEIDPVTKVEQSANLTEGEIKNGINTKNTQQAVDKEASRISAKLDEQHADPQKEKAEEIKNKRAQLGGYQKAADSRENGGNEDGIVDGSEDKKAREMEERDKETAREVAALVLAAGIQGSTGSPEAGMSFYNKLAGKENSKDKNSEVDLFSYYQKKY